MFGYLCLRWFNFGCNSGKIFRYYVWLPSNSVNMCSNLMKLKIKINQQILFRMYEKRKNQRNYKRTQTLKNIRRTKIQTWSEMIKSTEKKKERKINDIFGYLLIIFYIEWLSTRIARSYLILFIKLSHVCNDYSSANTNMILIWM